MEPQYKALLTPKMLAAVWVSWCELKQNQDPISGVVIIDEMHDTKQLQRLFDVSSSALHLITSEHPLMMMSGTPMKEDH